MAISKEETVLLTRPFRLDDLAWKPGHGSGNKRIAFTHADVRAYVDRLTEVFGDEWSSEDTIIATNERIISLTKLTIRGISRSDVGESLIVQGKDREGNPRFNENSATTARAQSFKRSCVLFGLGKYLYELGDMWGEYDGRNFTKNSVAQFRKEMNTEELRFWTWVEDTHPDKLSDVASLIVQGETYGAIAKKLTELVYV